MLATFISANEKNSSLSPGKEKQTVKKISHTHIHTERSHGVLNGLTVNADRFLFTHEQDILYTYEKKALK